VLSQSYSQTQDNPYARLVAGNWITIWTTLIQPYSKDRETHNDPAGPKWRVRDEAAWTPQQSQANMPGFGYNSAPFSYLETTYPWTDYKVRSITGFAAPAETVMFAASMVQYVDSQYGFYWVLGARVGWISWGNVDAPACGNPMTVWCGAGWGNNYNWTTLINAHPDDTNGNRSGGVSMRVARQGVFSFADGHTKRMPLSRAAAGTNWTPDTSNYSVVVTDPSKYMWDEN
jgi:hypothetical protein